MDPIEATQATFAKVNELLREAAGLTRTLTATLARQKREAKGKREYVQFYSSADHTPVGDTNVRLQGRHFLTGSGAHVMWAMNNERLRNLTGHGELGELGDLVVPDVVLRLNAEFYPGLTLAGKLKEGTILALNEKGKVFIEERGRLRLRLPPRTWRPFSGEGNKIGGSPLSPRSRRPVIERAHWDYKTLPYNNPLAQDSERNAGFIWTATADSGGTSGTSGARLLWANGGERLRYMHEDIPYAGVVLTDDVLRSLNGITAMGALHTLRPGKMLALNAAGQQYIANANARGLKRNQPSNIRGMSTIAKRAKRAKRAKGASNVHGMSTIATNEDSDSDDSNDSRWDPTVFNGSVKPKPKKGPLLFFRLKM